MSRKYSSAAIAALAVAAVLTVSTGSAAAYSHYDGCNSKPEWSQCYDDSGILYNAWISIWGQTSGASVTTTCVKARTQAGNTRSPTYCGGGNYQAGSLNGSTPTSQVYTYWGGGFGTRNVQVGASTP